MAIIDVIKYSGTSDVFAWKYPSEELGTWTQLIVSESQEAVLFKCGKALDVFQSGKHVLETSNIPLLCNIINIPFGGRSPFTAEVWYVNKAFSLDIKWGTATPIQLQDPKYLVFIPVSAFGQFGIRITDSKTFLTKLVGTLSVFDKTNLLKFFRGLILTKVKDAISSYLVHKQTSIMEINAYLDELSTYLHDKMKPIIAEYGVELVNFYVNDINVPEDDPAVSKLKTALARRAEMNIIGYSYQQERTFDALEDAVNTTGTTDSLMGSGIGLGVGMAVGGVVGTQFAGLAKNLDVENGCKQTCPHCGSILNETKKFCSECGYELNNCVKEQSSIKCYKCGCSVSSRSKFCSECGSALIRKCPSCEAVIEGASKFCYECGQKL